MTNGRLSQFLDPSSTLSSSALTCRGQQVRDSVVSHHTLREQRIHKECPPGTGIGKPPGKRRSPSLSVTPDRFLSPPRRGAEAQTSAKPLASERRRVRESGFSSSARSFDFCPTRLSDGDYARTHYVTRIRITQSIRTSSRWKRMRGALDRRPSRESSIAATKRERTRPLVFIRVLPRAPLSCSLALLSLSHARRIPPSPSPADERTYGRQDTRGRSAGSSSSANSRGVQWTVPLLSSPFNSLDGSWTCEKQSGVLVI